MGRALSGAHRGSCGETLDEAQEKVSQTAIETYVICTCSPKDRVHEIARPLDRKDVGDFLADPPGECVVEGHSLSVASEGGGCNFTTPLC